jgi:hypothetical protein
MHTLLSRMLAGTTQPSAECRKLFREQLTYSRLNFLNRTHIESLSIRLADSKMYGETA